MLKTERLTIKVLPLDKVAIEQLAQAEGEPVAVVVRRIIRAEAQRRGFWPPAHKPEAEIQSALEVQNA